MARKVRYELIDDLDGGEASETVNFGLDGNNFEIDLSAKNAGALRDALAKYVEGGRRMRGGRRGRGRSGGGRSDTAEIREWAISKGLKVSDRGRIPADILAQYEAAQR